MAAIVSRPTDRIVVVVRGATYLTPGNIIEAIGRSTRSDYEQTSREPLGAHRPTKNNNRISSRLTLPNGCGVGAKRDKRKGITLDNVVRDTLKTGWSVRAPLFINLV